MPDDYNGDEPLFDDPVPAKKRPAGASKDPPKEPSKHRDPDEMTKEEVLGLADRAQRYYAPPPPNGNGTVLQLAKPSFRVRSFRDVIAQAEPIRWVIPYVLQRGMIYSLTARYGAGKSTLAVLLSLLVGAHQLTIERKFGPYPVRKGRVLCVINENRAGFERMLMVAAAHFGVQDADVTVIDGRLSLASDFDAIKLHIGPGPFDLVLIDTAFSLFEGKEENSNKEMLDHARKLRRFAAELPGEPSAVALAHPTKHAATREDLVPRGGSSFTGELDGNFVLWKDDDSQSLEFSEAGKMRGPGDILIRYAITGVHDSRLDDPQDGTPGHAPVATLVTEAEAEQRADETVSTQQRALEAVLFAGEKGLSQSEFVELEERAGRRIARSTAKRALDALAKQSLVTRRGLRYVQQKPQQTRNRRNNRATGED